MVRPIAPEGGRNISAIRVVSENGTHPSQWQLRKERDPRDRSKCRSLDKSKDTSIENTGYHEMIMLPSTFRPGLYDVICGRGKDVLQHPGNCRYRELINSSLRKYVESNSKLEKTLLVTSIVKLVEDASSEGGGFIKKVNGVWYKVSEWYAREKCGQR